MKSDRLRQIRVADVMENKSVAVKAFSIVLDSVRAVKKFRFGPPSCLLFSKSESWRQFTVKSGEFVSGLNLFESNGIEGLKKLNKQSGLMFWNTILSRITSDSTTSDRYTGLLAVSPEFN